MSRFDTEALALAQRALGIIYNTATPGGDVQLLARLQNLFIEGLEHSARCLHIPEGWEPCSPEWISRNGPCACAEAPRIAFGPIGKHYHPSIWHKPAKAPIDIKFPHSWIDSEGLEVMSASEVNRAWIAVRNAISGDVPDDYFASLVSAARQRAAVAMERYPQPNYVLNKVSEESGEVVKEVIHYAEGRGQWARVEDEIVDNLAMLFRLVVEGDQVIGFIPPYLKKDPADE